MRITIIVDDKSMGVDGVFASPVDLSMLNPEIHAIQWHGEYGEIEFKTKAEDGNLVKPANERLTSIEPYLFLLPAWEVAKVNFEAEQAAAVQKMRDDAVAAAAAEAAAFNEQESLQNTPTAG